MKKRRARIKPDGVDRKQWVRLGCVGRCSSTSLSQFSVDLIVATTGKN